jgi:hypothetical protein
MVFEKLKMVKPLQQQLLKCQAPKQTKPGTLHCFVAPSEILLKLIEFLQKRPSL